jgi:hypothetical protein
MDVRTWGLARARLGRVGRRVAVLATVALVGSLAAASVSSAASEMPEALPGQATMSEAAIAAAIEDMGENERAQLEPRMKDRSIRPLGYKRAYFRFVTDPDGSTRVQQVDLSLDGLIASVDASVASTVTTTKYDLYMSQYVGRTSTTGTYEYLVETYFDWQAGNNGMNNGNCAVDLLGVAWGGGQLSQGSRGTQSGKYGNYITGQHNVYDLDIQRWDVIPQVGMEYRFHEWQPAFVGCSGAWKMEWGRTSLYLRKSTYSGSLTTIVSKYFHTWTVNNYSLSISGAPSITISPATDYWPAILAQDVNV